MFNFTSSYYNSREGSEHEQYPNMSYYRGNTIAIGIPCFNEELTIHKVINDIFRNFPWGKVYVFDNNSTDKTSQVREFPAVSYSRRQEAR